MAHKIAELRAMADGERLVAAFAFLLLTGCGTLPAQQEAPESCGFPDGTALSYAGRSTTAALNVQELVGGR